MTKWIILIFVFYAIFGVVLAYNNTPRQISYQINMKDMGLSDPQFIVHTFSECVGVCKNRSSSTSGGK